MNNDILDTIMNKEPEGTLVTATVSSLSPLQVKFYPADDAISVKCLNVAMDIGVNSNVLMARIRSQFIILGVIGTVGTTLSTIDSTLDTNISTVMSHIVTVDSLLTSNVTVVNSSIDAVEDLLPIDCMQISLTSTQYVDDTAVTKVEFNSKVTQVGSNLTKDSYGIKIGTDISTIEISCNLWVQAVNTNSYTAIYLYKNSTVIGYEIFPARAGSASNMTQTWRALHADTIIDVSENDHIYAYVKFNGADDDNSVTGAYATSCNLSVKVLDT